MKSIKELAKVFGGDAFAFVFDRDHGLSWSLFDSANNAIVRAGVPLCVAEQIDNAAAEHFLVAMDPRIAFGLKFDIGSSQSAGLRDCLTGHPLQSHRFPVRRVGVIVVAG